MDVSAVVVRRVAATDVAEARAIRLEMLTDSPEAFLETAAQFAARPVADIAARVAARATGEVSAQFVAVHGGRFVGSATAVADPEDPGEAGLFAVYVTPAHRGTGVLAALVDAAAGWARARGCTMMRLEVVTGNDRAVRAYEKVGFVLTDEVLPHPTKPGATERRMRRHLDGMATA